MAEAAGGPEVSKAANETVSRPATALASKQDSDVSVTSRLIEAARSQQKLRTKEEISILSSFLLSVPKLRKFQPSTAAELAACVSLKEVCPEEYVFMQGQPPEAYYVLVTGTCTLYIRDEDEDGLGRETKNLRPRDGIGENELMEGTLRPWSCKAVELTLLLEVDANVFMRVLSGGFIRERQEKINFLASLPQFKGMSKEVLPRVAHCFHEREFEAKEMVVRQGQPSRHLFVIKSGQVSVFVDPDYDPTTPNVAASIDPKKCMQVCLLGGGTFIGDMSLDGSRRAATVIALHAVVTYKVRRLEFKRIMPPETICQMRRVAEEKARFQKEHMAMKSTPLRDTIMLGTSKIPVPKKVLRGYGLRQLGILLDFGDVGDEEKSKSSNKKFRGYLNCMKSASIKMQGKPRPCTRRNSAPPAGLNSCKRLDVETAETEQQVSPIRTMLGHGYATSLCGENQRQSVMWVNNEPGKTSQHDTKEGWYGKRTSLVPQSPRSPRQAWSSQRVHKSFSGVPMPVLRSDLVQPDSPRPKTAQGRSPRGWSPRYDRRESTTRNSWSASQDKRYNSQVPHLALPRFGFEPTSSRTC